MHSPSPSCPQASPKPFLDALCKALLFPLEAPCKVFFLFGDNDDGDYVGVGDVVRTLFFFTWRPLVRPFFYLEAPCKVLFFTWRPLVRHIFYLEVPCQAPFFYLEALCKVFCLLGGSL